MTRIRLLIIFIGTVLLLICSSTILFAGAIATPAVAGGGNHTVALKSGGTVWAWGENNYWQLGQGAYGESHTPVRLIGLDNVTTIAAGTYHTVVLKSDGTVWALGSSSNGELGNGTTTYSATPVQAVGLGSVTAIAAGYYNTVALKSDGTVWAWGYNEYGKLGDGTTTNKVMPVQVVGLSGVTAIASGGIHTVALRSDGTVWTWGFNYNGQLGDNTTSTRLTPVQVVGLSGVTAIAAGQEHTVALKSDGTVWAWGYDYEGSLGDGGFSDSRAPVQVSGLSSVTAIAAVAFHTIALKSDGTVWAWGRNSNGELGDNTTTVRRTPVQVIGLNSVTAIAAGGTHTVAIRSDGTVWAWGDNEYGKLGDGTTYESHTPVQVSGLNLYAADNWVLSITKAGPGSGTVTSSPAGVSCGSTCSASFNIGTIVTLTATPASGVSFGGWTGGNCSGMATICSFSLNSDTAITADFRYGSFDDEQNNVYAPYIEAIKTAGVTQGCGNNIYCPSSNVTRAQMAAFIIRAMFGETFTYTTTPYYADVPSTDNFFKYIQKLRDLGITVTTGNYSPNDSVTRNQMAAFLARATQSKAGQDTENFTYTTAPYFSDVPATDAYFKYVQKLRDKGITTMTGVYNATSYVTRDQMAAFLSRAFLGMQ